MSVILTDIEGTTSSIGFVKDVLFPYARRTLPAFVQKHRDDPEVRHWLDRAALEIGGATSDSAVVAILQQWIDEDRKDTALKALQGLIWQQGYAGDDFRAHIYADAAEALTRWDAQGHELYVYSSGSAPAQKLFFGHTEAGNLLHLFSGFFDTEIGPKRQADSYRGIVERIGTAPADILFLSDVIEELDAAREAGLRTCLVDRREDYPQPRDANGHHRVERFDQLDPNA
ncbi:MAG: acireductone synthase [Lysobacteraceae bacterium]